MRKWRRGHRKLEEENPLLKANRCQCCGKALPAGSSFYLLRAEITAGFDGILPEPAADPEQLIQSALAEIAKKSAEENEGDVYEEITLLLCPACRLAVRQELRAIGRYDR